MTRWHGDCPSAELWLRTQGSQRQPAHATRWHFPVARASVAPQSQGKATKTELRGVTCTPTPLVPAGKGLAAVVAATLKCWDSMSLPHLIRFANACVARYAK